MNGCILKWLLLSAAIIVILLPVIASAQNPQIDAAIERYVDESLLSGTISIKILNSATGNLKRQSLLQTISRNLALMLEQRLPTPVSLVCSREENLVRSSQFVLIWMRFRSSRIPIFPIIRPSRQPILVRMVGVSHACGHDIHTSVQLGVASVLAGLRDDLPGTVLFIFQPAEEGPPLEEGGGAKMMLEQGAFDDPRPSAVFGLHTLSELGRGDYRFYSRTVTCLGRPVSTSLSAEDRRTAPHHTNLSTRLSWLRRRLWRFRRSVRAISTRSNRVW